MADERIVERKVERASASSADGGPRWGGIRRHLADAVDLFGVPLAIFVVVRLCLLLLVYAGHILVPLTPGLDAASYPRNLLLDGWKYWDSGFYVSVVTAGYYYPAPPAVGNVAFFPLFAVLLGLAARVIPDPFNAGLLVANLCFAAALCALYGFVRTRWGRDVAFRSCLLLTVYPLGFYFGAVYSEALFLLLAVSSFALAEAKRWWLAGLAGMLCVLTRQMGVALGPALLILYLQQRQYDLRKIRVDVLALGLIPLGLAAYMGYLYVQFGDPLAFYHTTMGGFSHVSVGRTALRMIDPRQYGSVDFKLLLLINLVLGTLFLASTVPVAKRLGLAYGAFVFLAVGVPFAVGLISLGRYMSIVFPTFILLARWLRDPLLFALVVAASSLLMGLLAILFANRYWVF